MRHLACIALLASGVASASPAVAQVKIGSFVSATGPAAFLGEPERQTLQIYVERINAEGGVNGEPIELILYDDEGDANKARTFASRLIDNDGVVAIVGGSTTGTTMAAVPLAEDAGIPFVSMAGAITIVEPVKEWVFKTPPTDRMACKTIFADMQARGLSKIGLISGTDAFGSSMREQCLAVAGEHGIEILADETYGPRDSDMTPQLTKIRGTEGVQAVLNPGFGQGPAIVTRNYRQLGIELPLYQSHGVASKSFIELAGEAADGVRLPASALLVVDKLPDGDPQKPVLAAYKETFEKGTGKPVSTFGGHAYDGLMIVVDAIKRAGDTDPEAIRDAIEQTDGFVGTAGAVKMTPDDHMGLGPATFRMLEIRDGDWVLAE